MSDSIKNRLALLKIAEKLSKVQQGVAKDDKGNVSETYLKYLSLMYNPEEAEIVQHLGVFPKAVRVSKLARELGKDKGELKEILGNLAKKGFLQKLGSSYCIPTPLMVYDAPFVLKINYEEDKERTIELARLSRKFFEKDNYYKSWETSYKGTPRSRILTVSEKIKPEKDIIPIEEVYNIIDNNESFSLQPCPCRKRAELEGIRKCKGKYPIHNCISVGNAAEGILGLGDPVIKRVTKEEVKEIIRDAGELGLVHTTDNYSGPSTILCSCCECCCGLLAGLTRLGFENPKSIAKANYLANVDINACVACRTCLDRCKFGAITVEDTAIINEEICMGCGLCSVTCPNDAITMRRLERETIPTPKR
ncbi:MAG: 4Fe-4S binding protein [Candidatus Helarchaeota archaeon]|nr:4Fe-4S binding protein [Candidatus Helarchaeota archaeon]